MLGRGASSRLLELGTKNAITLNGRADLFCARGCCVLGLENGCLRRWDLQGNELEPRVLGLAANHMRLLASGNVLFDSSYGSWILNPHSNDPARRLPFQKVWKASTLPDGRVVVLQEDRDSAAMVFVEGESRPRLVVK